MSIRKFLRFALCIYLLYGCSGPLTAKNIEPKKIPAVKPVFSQGRDTILSRLTFVYGDRPSLVKACKSSWGLVILLDFDGRKILFNAGGSEEIMRNNMNALNIDPKELDALVISHHHWEMVDGIGYIMKENPTLPIYATDIVIDGLDGEPWGKNLRKVPDKLLLTPNILLMTLQSPRFEGGPFGIPEVHIVIKTSEGLVILQGCGHPRIVNIMEKSIEATGEKRVYMIAGGTRLLKQGTVAIMPDGTRFTVPQMHNYTDDYYRQVADELLAAGVKKIIPTHCTGDAAEAIFKEKFGDKYIHQTLGMKVDIPGPN